MICVLIVEDEPLSRRALRELVEQVDWLELVGEAADGRQAVEYIDRLTPDLVFLDVHMPELSGIEVARRLDCKVDTLYKALARIYQNLRTCIREKLREGQS